MQTHYKHFIYKERISCVKGRSSKWEMERLFELNKYFTGSGRIMELYMLGAIKKEDIVAVAVVGSRNMSVYGAKVCRFLVQGLAAAGVTIISGLMRGVDLCAHQTALKAGGRTLAVLGYGFNHFPYYTTETVRQIIQDKRGAIISEYPPENKASYWTYPKRNRLVAALAQATIIIEAARDSGSLITSGNTLEQGKQIFVVPGSIFSTVSRGKHKLLKEGAVLIDSPDDVLQYLGILSSPNGAVPVGTAPKNLPDAQKQILQFMQTESEALSPDDLTRMTGLAITQLQIHLTSLEIKNLVKKTPTGKWQMT